MAVSLIDEQRVERLKLVAPIDAVPDRPDVAEPPPKPKPELPIREFMAGALGVLTGIAAVLSVRFALMLAGVGAFVLAYAAVQHPSAASLTAMGLFDVLVFVPVVILARLKG